MRRTRPLLVSMLMIACGGGSADDRGDAGVSDCGPMVSTASEAASCVPDGPWLMQLSAAADRPISGDLEAAREIVLDGDTIALPDPCPDCLDHVRFQSEVEAIVLEDEAGDDYLVRHRRARIPAGTRFRIRVKAISEFPFFPVVIPTVRFLPATGAPCASDEERCAADAVCYRLARVCYDCDRRGGPACACIDDDNQPRAEGSACEYALSFDHLAEGTCQDGTCASE